MNDRLRELAKLALVYDERNKTKLIFHFPDEGSRAEFLSELYEDSQFIENQKEKETR